MDNELQTPSHPGLRAWFELLRPSRDGRMPKYKVDDQEYVFIHCSSPECCRLAVGALRTTDWVDRQQSGTNYLFAFRHKESCAWRQRVGGASQSSFTTQPLESAYIYWALFEHKLNHK